MNKFIAQVGFWPQRIMGISFIIFGISIMIFPKYACQTFFTNDFLKTVTIDNQVGEAAKFLMQCFGSQSALCGILIWCTKFTKQAYLCLGLAVIPFVVFDWVTWSMGYITPVALTGDFTGNLIYIVLSIIGYVSLANTKEDLPLDCK